MGKINFLVLALPAFCFISCSNTNNPVIVEDNSHHPISYCSFSGLEIDFTDTCSYEFVISFMVDFDSITISSTNLGSTFYVYPDTGDYNYWLDYFANYSTVDRIFRNLDNPDSLILEIHVSGKKSIEEEKERFLQIDHLEILSIENDSKSIYVTVPENTEPEWEEYFKQYSFITDTFIIAVCTDS